MAQQQHRQESAGSHGVGSRGPLTLPIVDAEEARIFRQSLPAEEVSRDFLQDLLQEYQATQKDGTR